MNWKTLIALLLLLPICWWSGLTPLWTGVELAEHYVLSPEGSHCNEICVHPSSLVDPPQVSATLDIPYDEPALRARLIAVLPHPHAARDRPPSLLCSTSHILRAPPTLILANKVGYKSSNRVSAFALARKIGTLGMCARW